MPPGEYDEKAFDDSQRWAFMMHRDLGKLEGRVESLERVTAEISNSLTTIYSKLNEVWNVVSTDRGIARGQKGAWDKMAAFGVWAFNVLIAAITAYITLKYGK